MTPYSRFDGAIRRLVSDLCPADVDVAPLLRHVTIEPPRDPAHGDLAINAAMVLARPLGQKPRALAATMVENLRAEPDVEAIEIAGPGFINVRLRARAWTDVLATILSTGASYGCTQIGRGIRCNVEYVSANPTGPLHVGHVRGAAYGDALANLLAFCGYDVTREYYVNDAGAQIDILARSVYFRYMEVLGKAKGEIAADLYPANYLVAVGKALAQARGQTLSNMSESEWLPIVRDFSIDAMMALIRDDLALLAIRHDVFFSERSLHAGSDTKIAALLADLRHRDLVYEGRLPPPRGKPAQDWEDRPQTLFRACAFGDDMDRPLIKPDGSYTYFAADIAYFADKFARRFDQMIYVLGADHDGYAKRLGAIAGAIAGERAQLIVRFCQLVRLLRGGEPVKMSKRAGTFVSLRDIVDEVGADAVRFMMLSRKNDAPLDFDFEAVVEQSRDNPVFYVQYAHARCHSVLRMAQASHPQSQDRNSLTQANAQKLTHTAELDVLKRLAQYPRTIEAAAIAHEPHRISFYLLELASSFHSLWNRGKEEPQLRFINDDDRELTRARLALVHAVALVISSGLSIVGVSAPKQMR